MRDHSHFSPHNDGVCAHCGQALPVSVIEYGKRGPNRTGLIVTVALHLLLIAIYFLQPHRDKHAAPPAGSTMVYVAPLPMGKPKPKVRQQQAPKKTPKTPPVQMQRLPNTITLPHEKPVEVVKEEPKPVTQPPPPEMDMQAYIDARRKARGAKDPSDQPSEESENARATRIAQANIAAANGRSRGDDGPDKGLFSMTNKTFHSVDLQFRGMNPNFKRRWLQQVTVEQGNEADLETAVIKKMIEMIRKEVKGDNFTWTTHSQRAVLMSARPENTEQLFAFLMKDTFPDYKPPAR